MKKITKIMLCLPLLVTLCACGKDKPQEFITDKTYTDEQNLSLDFRAFIIDKLINPTNQSDEYEYRYNKDDQYTAIDLQFYAENLSDQQIQLENFTSTTFTFEDEEEVTFNIAVEQGNYQSVQDISTLEKKEKAIVHYYLYFEDAELETLIKNEEKIKITLFDTAYEMPIKEIMPHEEALELNKLTNLGSLTIQPISASASPLIPPLQLTDESNFYQVENDHLQYAGMYVEIENKKDQPLNLTDALGIYLTFEEKEPLVAWYSILSEDNSMIEDFATEIPANSKRSVLFFVEIPIDKKDTDYTFHIFIEGKPYQYTFTHKVFVER